MKPDLLPQRALLDTSACVFAFRGPRNDPDTIDCKEFVSAMIKHDRDILIAAPCIAELQRKYETPLPSVRNIQVVDFDRIAAERLAQDFPDFVFQEVVSKPSSRAIM